MAMLVLSDTWPASTGFLSCADVNVRTKSFFAGFHCPDSLSSVTTTSLTFCVRIGFMSAAGADWTPAVIRAPTATITSKAFAMSSSLLSPIRRPHRRPGFVVGVMAACVTLRAAEILLAEPGEDHRRDDQHEPERAHHAAQHRGRERLHDLRPGRVTPHDRKQAGHHRADRHDFWAEPQKRPLLHGLEERLPRQAPTEILPLASDGFFQVDHHHHGRLHRGPEQRDEADPDGDREVVAEAIRSEEHTSELQSPCNLVCRLLLEKKKKML